MIIWKLDYCVSWHLIAYFIDQAHWRNPTMYKNTILIKIRHFVLFLLDLICHYVLFLVDLIRHFVLFLVDFFKVTVLDTRPYKLVNELTGTNQTYRLCSLRLDHRSVRPCLEHIHSLDSRTLKDSHGCLYTHNGELKQ